MPPWTKAAFVRAVFLPIWTKPAMVRAYREELRLHYGPICPWTGRARVVCRKVVYEGEGGMPPSPSRGPAGLESSLA